MKNRQFIDGDVAWNEHWNEQYYFWTPVDKSHWNPQHNSSWSYDWEIEDDLLSDTAEYKTWIQNSMKESYYEA